MKEYEQRVTQDKYPPADPPPRPDGPGWYIVNALVVGTAAFVYVWQRDVTPEAETAPAEEKPPDVAPTRCVERLPPDFNKLCGVLCSPGWILCDAHLAQARVRIS